MPQDISGNKRRFEPHCELRNDILLGGSQGWNLSEEINRLLEHCAAAAWSAPKYDAMVISLLAPLPPRMGPSWELGDT